MVKSKTVSVVVEHAWEHFFEEFFYSVVLSRVILLMGGAVQGVSD